MAGVRYAPMDADGGMAMDLESEHGHVELLLTKLGLTDDNVEAHACSESKAKRAKVEHFRCWTQKA